MTRRRALRLAAGFLVVAGLAGLLAWWVARPSPFAAAYGRIVLGMAEADSVALARACPRPPAAPWHGVDTLDWTGNLAGELRHVHSEAGDGAHVTPALLRERAVLPFLRADLSAAPGDDGSRQVIDSRTGRVIARWWASGRDELAVRYDDGGRVVEKLLIQHRGPSFRDAVRQTVEAHWPF